MFTVGRSFILLIFGAFYVGHADAIVRDRGGIIKGGLTKIKSEFRGEGTQLCGTVTFFAAATLENVKAKDIFAFDTIAVSGSSCRNVVISGAESSFVDSHVSRITVAEGDGTDCDDERILVLKGDTVIDDVELESSITIKVEGKGVRIGNAILEEGTFELEAGDDFP